MTWRGPDGRRGRLLGAALVSTGSVLIAALLSWFFAGQGRDASDEWASILQLLLAWSVATGTVVAWLLRRASRSGASTSGAPPERTALDRLRQAVWQLWSREVTARSLHLPRPLRLRWRPASQPGVQANVRLPPGTRIATALGGPAGTSAAELAAALRDPAVRQVVVLGEPGAGKTTLAQLHVVAAVTDAGPDDPVPVLLSLAGWRPGGTDGVEDPEDDAPDGVEDRYPTVLERFEDWLVGRICQDHPQVTPPEVRELVERRKVVPVLDGLDEMPELLRRRALVRLEEAAGAGLRMVITSRSAEFRQAVTAVGVLPQAIVVEVEPIAVDDAVTYLTEREARGSERWDPVTRAMTADPRGPLASALSTPLMIALARQVYRRPESDPSELTLAASAGEVEQRLLDRFLPSLLGPEQAAKAGRRLAFLVRHLPVHPRDPDLRWWRLPLAVSRSVITALVTGALTAWGALVGVPVVLLGGGEPDDAPLAVGVGAALGFLLGLIAGRHAGRAVPRSVSPTGQRAWLTAAGNGLWDVCVALAILSSVAAVALLVTWTVAPADADLVSATIVQQTRERSANLFQAALQLATLWGISVVVTNGLGAGRTGMPRRSTPRLRLLPAKLLTSLAAGALVGSPWVVLGAFHILELDLRTGLLAAAAIAGIVGVPLGVGRWLSSPVREEESPSPGSVLRADRTALLTTTGIVTATVGLLATLSLLYAGANGREARAVVLASCAAVVGLVLFGSGAVWLSYTVARLWLALRGRLPWRLMGFLRHAHRSGVLRQAGAVYQIRHDLLRHQLIGRWDPDGRPEVGSATVPPPAAVTRRDLLVRVPAVGLAVASLPVTAWSINPYAAPLVTIDGWAKAISADGSTMVVTDASGGRTRVWNTGAGRPVSTLARPLGYSDRVILSDDGRKMLTVDRSGGTRLWDTATGQAAAALSTGPDADPAILGRIDPAILGRIDPTFSGRVDPTILGRIGLMGPVFFDPRLCLLVAVTTSGRMVVWHTDTGQKVTIAESAQWRPARTMVFGPDGNTFATIDHAYRVRLWNPGRGRMIAVLGRVPQLGEWVSPDGDMLVTLTADGRTRLSRTATGREIATFDGSVLGFSPRGDVLAVDDGGRVTFLDTTTGRATGTIDVVPDRLVFSATGSVAVTVIGENRVEVWRTATGAPIASLPSDAVTPVSDVLLSADGTRLVTRHHVEPEIGIWDPTTGRGVGPPREAAPPEIGIWEATTGRNIALLREAARAAGIRLSPDGRTVATVGPERTRLWDTGTGDLVAALRPVDPDAAGRPVDPYDLPRFTDGGRSFVASGDDAVRVWRVPR